MRNKSNEALEKLVNQKKNAKRRAERLLDRKTVGIGSIAIFLKSYSTAKLRRDRKILQTIL